VSPTQLADRRHARVLREDAREAKERLSRAAMTELLMPIVDRDVHRVLPLAQRTALLRCLIG